MSKKEHIISFLKEFMDKALPLTPIEDYFQIPFLEMGANSLILMQVQQAIENRYRLTIEIPQFFEELTNMESLVDYIEAKTADKDLNSLSFTGAADLSLIDSIFTQQVQTASQTINNIVSQQLQFLGEMGVPPFNAPHSLKTPDEIQPLSPTIKLSNDLTPTAFTPQERSSSTPETMPRSAPEKSDAMSPVKSSSAATSKSSSSSPAASKSSSALMHKMLSPLEIRSRGLTERQREHLEALIKTYTKKTGSSKELTARYRPVLADSRAAVGFRFTTKEMLYPIIGKCGKGARIWDIDGNEYVDITMGQGVILFGHDPKFIADALKASEADRLLGPRPSEVGEAAELICELTGMERVTFTNTGTEAVMAAVRLARTATRRNKIVMFENAYHGHADNVMGSAVWKDDKYLHTAPAAPGITQGAVDDLWVLEYDTKQALDFIRSHANEIAAVIVEPVQSRRPDLQPREFLHELRDITTRTDIIFIFDEMITGFRVHPGGAQAIFGVKADIATYGKVLGGGMPIGAIAGKAKYMDAIDGGAWQYNDASYPKVNRTVFGGTFCQHPTAMITALATLRHLKARGPELQLELNRKTKALADDLNLFFNNEEIPIEVVYFGSLFRFSFSSNLELLFYHLMVKGVFIWEWRNYFLCTAHTDADIAHIIKSVKESVMEMKSGGFLPEKKGNPPEDNTPEDNNPEDNNPVSGKTTLTSKAISKKKN